MPSTVRVLSVLLIVALARSAVADDAFELRVDGRVGQWTCLPIDGASRRPGPGDVLVVRGVGIRLDGSFAPEFRLERDEYSLRRYYGGEPERLLALSVDEGRDGDPFAGLSDDEVRGLRGLELRTMNPAIQTGLLRIDPAKCCVTLQFNDDLTALPVLPEGLECLRMSQRGPREVNLAPLAKVTSLRILDAWWAPDTLAVETVGKFAGLRCLTFDLADGRNPAPLTRLADLRYLDVAGRGPLPAFLARQSAPREEIEDVAFVRKLEKLRHLSVQYTGLKSLAPLAGHPALETVLAARSLVAELPDGKLPALRRLDVLGSDVTREGVAAFRALNPGCEVRWSHLEMLAAAVEGATRLRVRSGGTCHRDEAAEKTLYETTDAEEIRALLASIDPNPAASRVSPSCSCCGRPTFEFFRGGELLASVGVHHGVALRWDRWPGDIILTLDGIGRFCGWLEERGVPGPGEEAAEMIGRNGARQRRVERWRALVPEELWEPLWSSSEEARAALESAVADPVERVLLCLRLLGCEESSWNRIVGIEHVLLEDLVPAFDGATLGKAILRASDPQALSGAARVILGGARHAEVPREDLEAALPAIARRALAHPRTVNRRRAMALLAKHGGEAAEQALLAVVEGAIVVRELPSVEALEPEEMLEFLPLDSEIELDGTDRAFAAAMLAGLGCRAAKDPIEAALAASKDEAEQAELRDALRALEKSK